MFSRIEKSRNYVKISSIFGQIHDKKSFRVKIRVKKVEEIISLSPLQMQSFDSF